MLRDVKTEVFYPYPPERVWQVITNRHALAVWLMENDFEPRLGHKFRFQFEPQQGINNTIYCEVIQLDEPRCLSYTWRGSFMCQPTIVTWTLLLLKVAHNFSLIIEDLRAIFFNSVSRGVLLRMG